MSLDRAARFTRMRFTDNAALFRALTRACACLPAVRAHAGDALVAAIREGRVRLQWPDARRLDMANGIIAIGKRCMSARPEDRPGFVEVIEVS